MKLPAKIREFKAGDSDITSASRMNEIIAVINALRNLRAGPGIEITWGETNVVISSKIKTNQTPEQY